VSVTRTSAGRFTRTGNRNGPDLLCKCCYQLAAGDRPVYLASFQSGVFTWTAPVCATCWAKGDHANKLQILARDHRNECHVAGFRQLVGGGQRPPAPCVWCGRSVVTGLRARRVACSTNCRVQDYRERRRQARVDHPDLCRTCQEPVFGRRGTTYCSSSCRQKAYRGRVKNTAEERARTAAMLRAYDAALLAGWSA